jgi:hypothetical protein
MEDFLWVKGVASGVGPMNDIELRDTLDEGESASMGYYPVSKVAEVGRWVFAGVLRGFGQGMVWPGENTPFPGA